MNAPGTIAQVREALQERGLAVGDVVGFNEGTINAEMAAGVEPAWYLVETVPGQEGVAAAHLTARRFGIFIPDMKYLPETAWDPVDRKWKIVRGQKLGRVQRMFVGYIFVFTWLDIDGKNWRRITAVPGVQGIVCWPEGRVARLTDKQVGEIRSLEAILCPIELPADWRKVRKKNGWRQERQAVHDRLEKERMLTSVKGWINVGDGVWIDTIEALRVLDGRDENQAVAKGLGLASQ